MLPSASVGTAYSANVSVSGGKAPYNFSLASGELPAGIGLSESAGTISGTPSAAGSFSFGLLVTDAEGTSQKQSLQIIVSSGSSTNGSTTSGSTTNSPTSSGSTNTTSTSTSSSTTSSTRSGTSISDLQRAAGWGQFGQRGPNYVDCSPSPCDGILFWMNQGVSSPSISGDATEFDLGGSGQFADGLWNNHLIGPFSSQGMPDKDQSMVRTLHNFTYDVYFYGDNLSLSQALEFDINQFFDGKGFIFGHECRLAGGNEWDVWDNQNSYWKHTGIPCHPNDNEWNHLTITVQRNSNDEMVYQSITLNGVTNNLNWTLGHGSAPGWYGLTINYQMDGNQNQDPYKVYLDKLTFSYE